MLDKRIRKSRSVLLRTVRWLASLCRICVARLANDQAVIPWSTEMGRGVTIRVTDGARLKLGHRVALGAGSVIVAKYGSITIGDDVFIGHGCTIVAMCDIRIGAHTLVAEYVTIRDQDHRVDGVDSILDTVFDCGPIEIGEGAWLAAKVSVLRDSHIGNGAVIGAHALVKGSIPDFAIAMGVPACVKRYRRRADAADA